MLGSSPAWHYVFDFAVITVGLVAHAIALWFSADVARR
jgi:hypothetical protein